MNNLKVRVLPECNYKAIWNDGHTIRLYIDPSKPITELTYPEFLDCAITSKCFGNCQYCAPAGTMINTPSGVVPIEEVRAGEIVLCYDEAIGQIVSGVVDQLFERPYEGELMQIEVEDGRVIELTPNHTVYTQRGWIAAGELTNEDEIISL